MSITPSPRAAQRSPPVTVRRVAGEMSQMIETGTGARARPIGRIQHAQSVFRGAIRVVDDYVLRANAFEDDAAQVAFRDDGTLHDTAALAALRRIEGHIHALLACRKDVLGWRTDRRGGEGKVILVDMLEHLLGEIGSWLTSLRDAVHECSELNARAEADGMPCLPMVVLVDLTQPPHIRQLDAWTNRYRLAPGQANADCPEQQSASANPPDRNGIDGW